MRIFMTLALGLFMFATTARAQDDPKTTLTRAITAHGGAANLKKLNLSRIRSSGTVVVQGMELAFTAETVAQLPDKLKTTLSAEVQGQKFVQVQVLNGDKGWLQVFGQTTEVPGILLAEMKEAAHASQCQTLVPLLEGNYRLTALKEIRVHNRPAVGVKIETMSRRDLSLYFDRETGLLLKAERRASDSQDPNKLIFRETFLSDYKEIDGVKSATKIVLLNDGQPYVNSLVTDTQYLDKIEPKTFDRP